MLRVTKLTDYATVVLTALAERPDRILSAAELAERASLELRPSARCSSRWRRPAWSRASAARTAATGWRARPAAITLVDIVEAMEGPLGMTECTAARRQLRTSNRHCGVRTNWRRINDVVADALRGVTLARDAAAPPRRATHPSRCSLAGAEA